MGEKLKGEWVLVRMKSDRFGGKRTNWLLIKHRDEYSNDGDGEGVLEDKRSVASGRTLEEIAAGKGKAPTPFMMTKRTAGAEAVWNSNKGLAAEARAANGAGTRANRKAMARGATRRGKASTKANGGGSAQAIKVNELPDFVAPQLCNTADAPALLGRLGA